MWTGKRKVAGSNPTGFVHKCVLFPVIINKQSIPVYFPGGGALHVPGDGKGGSERKESY